MEFKVNQVVMMKKSHPCGSNEFLILRMGIDFRLKCNGCGHLIMMNRTAFTKSVKKIVAEPNI